MGDGMHSLLAKSGKFELNQVRYSDTNRERGKSDLSSRRRWRHWPTNSQPGAHLASSPFSLGVTEPQLLSLRDHGKVGPPFIFLLQSVTDAGTPSGHCNELISAGRNPQSSFVNLHQIGSSVLPLNLIHPTVYTVVVHQIQGARAPLPICSSSILFLLFVSGKNPCGKPSWFGRYRASCLPAGSRWVPTIHIDICWRRSPPLSQGMSSNAMDPFYFIRFPRGSNAFTSSWMSVFGSISWFGHCPHGAPPIHMFAPWGPPSYDWD